MGKRLVSGRGWVTYQIMGIRRLNRVWKSTLFLAAMIAALLYAAHVMQIGAGSHSLEARNCPDEQWELDWKNRWSLPDGSKWWNRGSMLGKSARNYSAKNVYDDAVRLWGVESEAWIVTIHPHETIQLFTPNISIHGFSESVGQNQALHYRTEGVLSYLRRVLSLRKQCFPPRAPLQGSVVVVVNDVLKGGNEIDPQPLAPVGQNLSEIFREGHESSWWPVFSSPLLISSSAVDYRMFGSPYPMVIPIPDAQFLSSGGHQAIKAKMLRSSTEDGPPKPPKVCWRGASTGFPTLFMDTWEQNQRVQLVMLSSRLKSQGEEWLDAQFSDVVQANEEVTAKLKEKGLVGQRVKLTESAKCGYLVDVDGNANAWEGLFWKLMSGSPVFKIQSSHHFEQWYYERLRPWVHYIPVKADLSDFPQHFRWAYANPNKMTEMAEVAARAMHDITFDEQLKWGSKVLESLLSHYTGPLVGDSVELPLIEVDVTNCEGKRIARQSKGTQAGVLCTCTQKDSFHDKRKVAQCRFPIWRMSLGEAT